MRKVIAKRLMKASYCTAFLCFMSIDMDAAVATCQTERTSPVKISFTLVLKACAIA